MNHGLDTDERICFYEQEFYVLSNFSAFRLLWLGVDFDTAEHAYHWTKFVGGDAGEIIGPARLDLAGVVVGLGPRDIRKTILLARSAHDAFKYAGGARGLVRHDWQDIRVDVMRQILRAKADQHEYVRCKLLESGDRALVENSWHDAFWGEGPDGDGENMLGKLWMEIRAELKAGG